jgi:hypothetical protein
MFAFARYLSKHDQVFQWNLDKLSLLPRHEKYLQTLAGLNLPRLRTIGVALVPLKQFRAASAAMSEPHRNALEWAYAAASLTSRWACHTRTCAKCNALVQRGLVGRSFATTFSKLAAQHPDDPGPHIQGKMISWDDIVAKYLGAEAMATVDGKAIKEEDEEGRDEEEEEEEEEDERGESAPPPPPPLPPPSQSRKKRKRAYGDEDDEGENEAGDGDDDNTKCPHCLRELADPVPLPCGTSRRNLHLVCRACAQAMVDARIAIGAATEAATAVRVVCLRCGRDATVPRSPEDGAVQLPDLLTAIDAEWVLQATDAVIAECRAVCKVLVELRDSIEAKFPEAGKDAISTAVADISKRLALAQTILAQAMVFRAGNRNRSSVKRLWRAIRRNLRSLKADLK